MDDVSQRIHTKEAPTMGTKRKTPDPHALRLTPNGRLTEHTAMIDVGNAPEVTYGGSGTRRVTFAPTKLVVRFQWSWTTATGWHVLEVKALGRNGGQDLSARFPRPETAPGWVQEAITMATPPALELALAG